MTKALATNIPAHFISTLDVSLLKPNVKPSDIKEMCDYGLQEGFHLCINSCYADITRKFVGRDFPYAVAACVSFPFGGASTYAKVAEAKKAIEDGASEVDMVMAIGKLKEGKEYYPEVQKEIENVVNVVKVAGGDCVKVIIETCYLTDEEKEIACKLVCAAGAGFVKTSTGYGTGGATVKDIKLMRRVSDPNVRIKAAGGIRTLEQCLDLLEAGSDRLGIGMSSAKAIIDEYHQILGK